MQDGGTEWRREIKSIRRKYGLVRDGAIAPSDESERHSTSVSRVTSIIRRNVHAMSINNSSSPSSSQSLSSFFFRCHTMTLDVIHT